MAQNMTFLDYHLLADTCHEIRLDLGWSIYGRMVQTMTVAEARFPMISQQHESEFPLIDLPWHVASRPSVRTVRRWASRGVRGAQLHTWLIGGRRYTSTAALHDFLSKLRDGTLANQTQ
jgi:hypothetical protein